MKRLLIFLLIIFSLTSNVFAKEWYEDGTLHGATASEWLSASYQNRLATAADFLAYSKAAANMNELKVKAISLERCITEAINDPRLHEQKISEIAAGCIILLKLK
jgi:hypothetical protein